MLDGGRGTIHRNGACQTVRNNVASNNAVAKGQLAVGLLNRAYKGCGAPKRVARPADPYGRRRERQRPTSLGQRCPTCGRVATTPGWRARTGCPCPHRPPDATSRYSAHREQGECIHTPSAGCTRSAGRAFTEQANNTAGEEALRRHHSDSKNQSRWPHEPTPTDTLKMRRSPWVAAEHAPCIWHAPARPSLATSRRPARPNADPPPCGPIAGRIPRNAHHTRAHARPTPTRPIHPRSVGQLAKSPVWAHSAGSRLHRMPAKEA